MRAQVPFLADLPEALLDWVRAYGDLRTYQPGQCIIPPLARVRGCRWPLGLLVGFALTPAVHPLIKPPPQT